MRVFFKFICERLRELEKCSDGNGSINKDIWMNVLFKVPSNRGPLSAYPNRKKNAFLLFDFAFVYF